MTIQYKHHVCTASPLNLFRLSLRWRGSIWKAVVWELIAWTLLYQAVAVFYFYGLNEFQQRLFRKVVVNMNKRTNYIPLEFILGFFVNAVVSRWTDAVHNMGYLDDQAIYVAKCIEGHNDKARMIRRSVVRYLCLTQVLVYRDICETVRKRFPTYESVVKAGYMLPDEQVKLESYKKLEKFTLGDDDGKYFLPLNWAFARVLQARRENYIKTDIWCGKVLDEIRKFQASMQRLCNYDWVKVPLAYPQFVFLAVHVYFLVCLFGRQFVEINPKNKTSGTPHVIIPIITILQLMFYLGWMKVAASLTNPFGEDDVDFESNFLIDKNFATCMCIVDDAYDDLPEIRRDKFWSQDITPLYSVDSARVPNNPLIGSAARKSRMEQPTLEPRMTIVRRSTHAKRAPTLTPVTDVRF